jgi:endo-beta-N-acetylglucosaminidase D
MKSWTEMMCATLPANEWRGYLVLRHQSLFPNSLADRQKPTVQAMIPTMRVNAEVMNQQNAELIRRKQADDAQIRAQTQTAINNIHAIGAATSARIASDQQAHDAQHAGYWAQQDTNARNSQGFSNYILDQTVVQDNNMYNNGTIGHGTLWNNEADALVKADPNRFEYVTVPNYWRGTDFVP